MEIRPTFGVHRGEIQNVRADAAHELIESGRATDPHAILKANHVVLVVSEQPATETTVEILPITGEVTAEVITTKRRK